MAWLTLTYPRATDPVLKKDDAEKEKSSPEMLGKTGGPEDDGEESELVKVKKQMKKIQQKQSKMKPTRQIPRVREEANRQRGKRAIEEEIYS